MATRKKEQIEWTPVDPYGVIVADKDKNIFIGGELIDEVSLKNLQEEVKILKNLAIWKIMQETVRQKAIEKGLIESMEWEETLSAKMMLHNLGILRSIIKVIEDKKVTPRQSYTPSKFTRFDK